MFRKYLHILFPAFMLIGSSYCKAQGVAISPAGTSGYTAAILDLSNGNTTGSYGFLLPYVNLSTSGTLSPVSGTSAKLLGLMVYNMDTLITTTNGLKGAGLYYWTGSIWSYIGPGGNGAKANNGIYLGTDTMYLGGTTLEKNTKISINTHSLFMQGSSDTTVFTSTGKVGIGNTKKTTNTNAVLDLTNPSSHLALLLPSVTTANLPPLASAPNGLILYNSSTGCYEYMYGNTWNTIMTHGSQEFQMTGGEQSWKVPQCVTVITIVAAGGSGGYAFNYKGGPGAAITVSVSVVSGNTLDIVVGDAGQGSIEYSPNDYDGGGGGGGGSFVWDNANATYPLAVAGGGGGAGSSGNGATASTTTAVTATANCDAGGTSGAKGSQGTYDGEGGGGGGWTTTTGTAGSTNYGGSGVGKPAATPFKYGAGNTSNPYNGGYGGGGGGGNDDGVSGGGASGGGGGGYNGGGGGNAGYGLGYGGGGGSSGYYTGAVPYSTAADFVSPSTVTSNYGGPGIVIIYW